MAAQGARDCRGQGQTQATSEAAGVSRQVASLAAVIITRVLGGGLPPGSAPWPAPLCGGPPGAPPAESPSPAPEGGEGRPGGWTREGRAEGKQAARVARGRLQREGGRRRLPPRPVQPGRGPPAPRRPRRDRRACAPGRAREPRTRVVSTSAGGALI